jgi:putative ABC transport system permease protein
MGHPLPRLVLLAYPPDLRREFAGEIVAVFGHRLAAARDQGARAVWRLYWREIRDAVITRFRPRSPRPILPSLPPESPRHRFRIAMDSILQDLRFALRTLRSAPGFAAAAVIVLAVGIGANTAMFSVIDAVLLKPLPFREPGQLMALFETNPERGWVRAQVAAANYLDWRERSDTFVDIAAHNDWLVERARVVEGEAAVVRVNEVTGNFFDVLGADLILGTGFTAADDFQGGEPKIVLSHSYWQQTGADPQIVGTTMELDAVAHTVVGVAGPEMQFPFASADGWVPVRWHPDARAAVSFRRAHGMRAIGRVAVGATPAMAIAELESIAGQLEAEYPETNVAMGNGAVSLFEWVVGDTRTQLGMLFLAVGFVLLIACANVASMQLARATDRRAEMALRGALGARRLRLVRQTLIESLVLAFAGAAAGLALALVGVRALTALLPADFPRAASVELSGRTLAFTLAAAVVTGIVFGLAPALRGTRAAPGLDLGSARGTADRGTRRLAGVLVAAEIALVLPVAISATLMVRTLDHMGRVDPGFDTEATTVFGISLPRTRYIDGDTRAVFFDALLTTLRQRPEIDGAAVSTRLPFGNQRWSSDFRAESWGPDEYGVGVRHDEISRELFSTMQVQIREGRDSDRAELDETPVVIVNRALADLYFPDKSIIGERLCFDRLADDCRFWYTVVGVVDNVRRESLTVDEKPSIYGSLLQNGSSSGFLLVRSELPTEDVVALVSGVVREFDNALPFHTVTTMGAMVRESIGRERLLLGLLGAFALMATVLAAFGVYSVVAYSTAGRTREIGVRISLGARRADIMRTVLSRGMAPVLLGAIVGLGVTVVGAGVLSGFVFGVTVRDPLTYVTVAGLLAAIAVAACVVPGRRAVRVDPVDALRAD